MRKIIKVKSNPFRLKKLVTVSTFALISATLSFPVNADIQGDANALQSEIDSFFGDMSNVTVPGVFETQRRGVISGGRYTLKTKIFDENLVNFVPPSWKGGCGGIDMFGGSFSFISSDQLVQLLRQVASNGKGYAFQLAIDNVCPTCSKHMESFQKKMQALNQHLGNSCQLAQGIVNDAIGASDNKAKTDASIAATTKGLVSDVFGAREEVETGKSSEEELGEALLLEKELIGNVVWQQLKKQNVQSWFSSGGSDDSLLEIMMSLTGTLIRTAPIPDPEDPGDPSDAATSLPLITKPPKEGILQAILSGGTVKAYECDDSEKCFYPGDQDLTVDGMALKIQDMLLGSDSKPGIIFKFANNQGKLTDSETALMSSLPAGAGTIIRNLSVLSEDASRMFVLRTSNSIALEIVYTLTEELFRAVLLSISQSKSPHAAKALKDVSKARNTVYQDFLFLQSQNGDMSELIDNYNSMLSTLRKKKYISDSVVPPQQTRN
ncbi:conjugal transfer protein TraH [Marinomonas algarum]|uniref:Conjugal transfer protein TraH n=1 Tax=Marinomonas algarum TaxID=2883105 RepID=A0A9X1INY3_9GAMM|nr:conjugal transfer protein TraH [Marinomonas algarum]MCB5162605.1 conjugal transfer protein TraH [Marinomonas algarum]